MTSSINTSHQYITNKSNAKQSIHVMTYHDENEDDDDDDDSSIMSLDIGSGDIGVLQDMTGATSALNGKIVKVKHESSNRKGQWLVQLYKTRETLVVDSENLLMALLHE
ncbi:unnamed protein product [Cylindrotheca closterium]|uniref:Uncharacterized protein n=1 Tax=Cylindrotheca closterium TaxID=2856 RepID=A0AAD2GB31_9STRA|nr:unnamed protein product [Cylindrotheca closterium]